MTVTIFSPRLDPFAAAPSCPNGATSQSPGLAHRAYPGSSSQNRFNPNGVAAFGRRRWTQPRWGWAIWERVPRVAAWPQPWAGGRNPVGIRRNFIFYGKYDQFADAPNAVAKMREPSANGASYNSLGQRPRTTARHSSPALKGRTNPAACGTFRMFNPGGWIALSGLHSFSDAKPRALPWAGMVCPVGAGGSAA